MSFHETLQAHLTSMQQRDLATFLTTITEASDLTLILPNGTLISGRSSVVAFLEQWFADPDWSLAYEIIRSVEAAELAFAVMRVTYSDRDGAGQPYQLHYYLQLVFAFQQGQWRLIHDQNTVIPTPATA